MLQCDDQRQTGQEELQIQRQKEQEELQFQIQSQDELVAQ